MAPSNPPSATQLFTQLALRLTSSDNEPIRGMKTPDGRSLFSVYDAMWNTGAYRSKGVVGKTFSRMISEGSDGKEEVLQLTEYVKFPGRGQRDTPCMEVSGLLKLLPRIGRKMGKAYWQESQLVLERYLDGDTTMCVEMEENKRIGGEEARARFALKVETSAAEMSDDDDDKAGYVYGMVSDNAPDHVKIGYTCDLERRLAEANTWTALKPYRYVATQPTATPRHSEACAHKYFADRRRAGEFFEVSVEDV
jgi:T5orf172 domain